MLAIILMMGEIFFKGVFEVLMGISLTVSEAGHSHMFKGYLRWQRYMCSLNTGWGREDGQAETGGCVKGGAWCALPGCPRVCEGAGGSAQFPLHSSVMLPV